MQFRHCFAERYSGKPDLKGNAQIIDTLNCKIINEDPLVNLRVKL
jgi:hypothetical protein